jgi:hypothetical protein
LQLQRTVGNRAVSRLIQAKLIVGSADDPYEREAERVAARFGAPASVAEWSGQRIQALPQTPAVGPEGGEAGEEIERQLSASKGAGTPLPPDTRALMEDRLGADFSAVRVHTGTHASALNRQLGAIAFTHGTDIYISEGQYNPASSDGQRLLAHELTHVVQQTGGAQRQGGHEPISRSKPESIQRLITSDQLKELAGEPHRDTLFGLVPMSSLYKKVLDALKKYHLKIAGVWIHGSLKKEDVDEVAKLLNELDQACQNYIQEKGDESQRTLYISALRDDILNEWEAINTILKDPSKYSSNLRNAIQRVRTDRIAAKAAEEMSRAAEGHLNEIVKNKPVGLLKTMRPQVPEAIAETALTLYGEDMTRIAKGDEQKNIKGREPTAMDWRGNLPATKAGSALGYLAGQDYFKNALVPALSGILSIPDELAEVDPEILNDERKRNKNMERMKAAYKSLVEGLFNESCADKVPRELRKFYRDLYDLALQKGMNPNEAYLLLSSQIFLRTITPMIINMVAAVPQGKPGKRALTIISLVLQKDANKQHGQGKPFIQDFPDCSRQIESFVRAVVNPIGQG